MPERILIFGGTGFLGDRLRKYCESSKLFEPVIVGRDSVPYSGCNDWSEASLQKLISRIAPSAVVNLIALTDVEICEGDYDYALEVNHQISARITKACENKCIRLIYISTDHLYDSNEKSTERDICLKNIYGISKYLGELPVQRFALGAVLRTNFVGSCRVPRKNPAFTDWLYSRLSSGSSISMYNDVIFNPLYVDDLCHIICLFISHQLVGTFNIGSTSGISKYNFALNFAQQLGLPVNEIRSISYASAYRNVNRPLNMVTSVEKFLKIGVIALPSITETMGRVVREYSELENRVI